MSNLRIILIAFLFLSCIQVVEPPIATFTLSGTTTWIYEKWDMVLVHARDHDDWSGCPGEDKCGTLEPIRVFDKHFVLKSPRLTLVRRKKNRVAHVEFNNVLQGGTVKIPVYAFVHNFPGIKDVSDFYCDPFEGSLPDCPKCGMATYTWEIKKGDKNVYERCVDCGHNTKIVHTFTKPFAFNKIGIRI